MLLILFQAGSRSIIYLNYFLNKDYVAANLCENKNKPKMSCEGKCHLKKQLDKETKREATLPSSLKEKQDYLTSKNSLTYLQNTTEYFLDAAVHNTENNTSDYSSPELPIFLPPKI